MSYFSFAWWATVSWATVRWATVRTSAGYVELKLYDLNKLTEVKLRPKAESFDRRIL